jgi:hypothetical protein
MNDIIPPLSRLPKPLSRRFSSPSPIPLLLHFTYLSCRSSNKLQPTPLLTNLTYATDLAQRPLIPRVILAPVKRTALKAGAAIDGREGGGAHLELGELVELDLQRVVRIALALGLGLACLL